MVEVDDGRRWRLAWTVMPGEYLLSATNAEGRAQLLDQSWERGGFAGNLVQRVPVFCPGEDAPDWRARPEAPGPGGGPPDRR
ncbi:hypothetical protein [Streptomyces sp. NPDC001652]|uniref:hypothetical protein n=1 Tax=Streptomyces sp. NPDC001652 TaxID=3154393 RepID=UPI003334571C